MADPANVNQAAAAHRIAHAALLDEEVRPHNKRFRAVAAIGPSDRVLDIGCGTGQSTREAPAPPPTGRRWASTSRPPPSRWPAGPAGPRD